MGKIKIFYNEEKGVFNICFNRSLIFTDDWRLIGELDKVNEADAFVSWVSSVRHLIQDPEFSNSSIREKPSLELVEKDWQIFQSFMPIISTYFN